MVEARATACKEIVGLMLESHLETGNQALKPAELRYGLSITDACLGWQETDALLRALSAECSRSDTEGPASAS